MFICAASSIRFRLSISRTNGSTCSMQPRLPDATVKYSSGGPFNARLELEDITPMVHVGRGIERGNAFMNDSESNITSHFIFGDGATASWISPAVVLLPTLIWNPSERGQRLGSRLGDSQPLRGCLSIFITVLLTKRSYLTIQQRVHGFGFPVVEQLGVGTVKTRLEKRKRLPSYDTKYVLAVSQRHVYTGINLVSSMSELTR
ncbi:hypothetical protein B0H19DRAFT_1056085 [Mycena capillaripes]|nr:hypothetical protein B0H19DRAFT_1056085 [Mycena capillaripes]